MKKTIALLCAILMLLMTACNKAPEETTTLPETTPQVEITTPIEEEGEEEEVPKLQEPVNTMERMTEVEGVLSVEKQTFLATIKQAVAYKMVYESEYGKLAADVILPEDYTSPYRQYSVLIFYSDTGAGLSELAYLFALRDIILVRPYLRGSDESEGASDLGGDKDLADAKMLLNILDQATFVQDSNLYIAGAGNFSMLAFRLMAEDVENRISGCAVANPITDLQAYYDMEMQDVKAQISNQIGKTPQEAPEEYELRSAVNFVDKLIGKPIFIIRNLKWSYPNEQITRFIDLLDKNDYSYHRLNVYSNDFGAKESAEGLDYLLSWINEQDQKLDALKVEENSRWYIVRTEWMKFFFSKSDYQKEDILPIVVEAVSLMADIRAYLGGDYTKDDAQGAVCYFNSSIDENSFDGKFFDYDQRLICRNPSIFVHEYAHMVSISSSECVYKPEKLFIEGLATYVQYTFHHATSQEYRYFEEAPVHEWDASTHKLICNLIAQSGVEYNAENYRKAIVALFELYGGYPEDRAEYPYEIGQIFVEYCVEELGGMQKFMSAFGDYLKFEDVYGKSVEEVVKEAREWNLAQFGVE